MTKLPAYHEFCQLTYGMRKYLDITSSVCQGAVGQTESYGNRNTNELGPVGLEEEATWLN